MKLFFKNLAGEIVWFVLGVLFCLAVMALTVLLAWALYQLSISPWFLDGSNPRFGS